MATSTKTRPAVQPRTRPLTVEQVVESTPVAPASPDPWYEDRPAYAVDKAALVFGVRVRHRVIPGTWKVVREAQRMDSCRCFRVRVREQADNGSLFGPVLSWNVAEVAGIVGDEPKAEPTPVDAPEPVQAALKPLTVAMAISIDGQAHDVTPIAPAPRAVKAFKFAAADGSCVVDEYPTGASCSCRQGPSRRAALVGQACLHIRAARQCGLIAEAPEPTPDPDREPRLIDDDGTLLETPREMDARHRAEHEAKVAELRDGNPFLRPDRGISPGLNKSFDATKSASVPSARETEQVPCCDPVEPAACTACATEHTPLPDPADADWADDDVVTLGPAADPIDRPSAEELEQAEEDGFFDEAWGEAPLAFATPEVFRAVAEGRAEFAREFDWVPVPYLVTRDNAIDLMTDSAIGDGYAEYRDRERAEGMRAKKAAMEARADEPEARSLADQVDVEARHYRTLRTPFGDLMAETIEALSARVRAVDAADVETFRDREDGVLASL